MPDPAATPAPDPKHQLVELANARMPYGRFKGMYLGDLPEAYLVWFSRQGFPEGKLGQMLREMLEMKTNGLERLLIPLRRRDSASDDNVGVR